MLHINTQRARLVLRGFLGGEAKRAPDGIAVEDGTCRPEGERRSEVRYVTTLRIGLLHTESGKELCVIKNISASGMAAQAYRRFQVGEAIQVELTCDQRLDGTVQWTRDYEIGIMFPQPIDVDATLATRWVTEDGRRYRLPRVDVECSCRLRIGTRSYIAKLVNVSQGGAMLQTQRPIEGNGAVVLTLPDLGGLEGSTRWNSDLSVGICFNERLPFRVLAQWVQEHRPAPPSDGLTMLS